MYPQCTSALACFHSVRPAAGAAENNSVNAPRRQASLPGRPGPGPGPSETDLSAPRHYQTGPVGGRGGDVEKHRTFRSGGEGDSGGSGSGGGAMNSGLPASAAPLGGVGIPSVKVKFCRYYAKDKTCFYGDECQFLHEEPSMASMSLHGGGSGSPVPLSGGAVTAAAAGYSLAGPAAAAAAACPVGPVGGVGVVGGTSVPKKSEPMGPAGTPLDAQLLSIPGMEGGTLTDANLTNSYFSSSFIGVNGFGSPAESKYSMMQRMTSSSSSPSLLNDGAKNFSHSAQDPVNSPTSSLFSDFGALSLSQRRKAPNPTASEFIPKGTPHMATMVNVPAFPSPLFSHVGLSSSTAAALAPASCPISTVESFERRVGRFLRKWLGLPRSLSIIAL
ncbi:PAN2-PAN3 deadenylation complex subunit Pan3 [Merluccius polli]|uniref:mRNA decay activator protein ZFP36 n=1 Tax=Merluccius polli TaxID=89951 RepID=A0AA47MLT2_MERPO|nr:PAN2-PAN3 deadenylation complex subunit Pan3 [Merluccius polli]